MKLNNGLRVLCYHSISNHKGTALDYIRVELETFKKQINKYFYWKWKKINFFSFFLLFLGEFEGETENIIIEWFGVIKWLTFLMKKYLAYKEKQI